MDEREALERQRERSRVVTTATWATILYGMFTISLGGLIALTAGLLLGAAVVGYLGAEYQTAHCTGVQLRDCYAMMYYIFAFVLGIIGVAGIGVMALRLLHRYPWLVLVGAAIAALYVLAR
jgi:hypothetical protein